MNNTVVADAGYTHIMKRELTKLWREYDISMEDYTFAELCCLTLFQGSYKDSIECSNEKLI